MINSVRNTVLSILNKNNYGYISPSDFNLFAKQAQLELFDGYFTDYNKIVTLENARRSHSGYADMGKQAVEVIEEFSTFTLPAYTSGNFFVLPSDFYYLTAVRYNSGSGIPVDAEYVKQEQINALLRSNLTPPSAQFPAYTIRGSEILLFPSDVATTGAMEIEYIREPRDPKWTYTSLSGGEPLFNASALDYQDFELPIDDEYRLVTKILQYAGLSIREQQVQAFANAQDVQEMQL